MLEDQIDMVDSHNKLKLLKHLRDLDSQITNKQTTVLTERTHV
jgi:hypothetical protein